MSRRRALMPSGRLPSGYIEVEYIQTSGTQYIDTGIFPSLSSKYDFEADVQMTSTQNEQYVIGADSDNRGNRFTVLGLYNNKFLYGYSSWAFTSGSIDTSTKYSVKVSLENGAQSSNINGVIATNNWTQYSQFLSNIKLFTSIIALSSYFSYAKMYFCKIYVDNVLTRNFVPCINPSNEVGMYDLLSKTFFGNAGTGSLIAGNPV